jgi:hypothetical protein
MAITTTTQTTTTSVPDGECDPVKVKVAQQLLETCSMQEDKDQEWSQWSQWSTT